MDLKMIKKYVTDYNIMFFIISAFPVLILILSMDIRIEAARLPRLIATAHIVFVITLYLLNVSLRKKGLTQEPLKVSGNMQMLLLTLALAVLMPVLGFLAAGVIFIFVCMYMLAKVEKETFNWKIAVVFSLIVPILVYMVFTRFFLIRLPASMFF